MNGKGVGQLGCAAMLPDLVGWGMQSASTETHPLIVYKPLPVNSYNRVTRSASLTGCCR